MRHIIHTVEHASLAQAAADFAPHDGACTPYAYSAHPLCVFRTPPMRIPLTPYACSAH